MNKVFLHACCAVCAAYPIERLTALGFEPVIYFFNPNISPDEEYRRRKDELVRYCCEKNIELVIEESSHDDWLDFISGLEKEPEKGKRCAKCFEYRLNKTAKTAKTKGFSYFTTTLSVSPHKNSTAIFDIAKIIAHKYDLNFVEENFKKQNGFKRTIELAKENDFYRQNYCGCEFSIR